VTHLLLTVNHLLLQALFTESSRGELPLPPSLVERLVCQLHLQSLFTESSCRKQSLPLPLLWWRGLPAGYFCRLCLLKVCAGRSFLFLPPSLVHSKNPALSTACPFQFLVYYSVVFGRSWGQSVQGAMLVYPRSGCGSTTCCLFAHLLVCVSQARLEPTPGGRGDPLVSQCNVLWRSFAQAGGLGCQSFAYSWCFFPSNCGKIFDLRSSHCLFPPSSRHLGSPLLLFFIFSSI
jgi:hypothetical protein